MNVGTRRAAAVTACTRGDRSDARGNGERGYADILAWLCRRAGAGPAWVIARGGHRGRGRG
jgi:hypothetical protein